MEGVGFRGAVVVGAAPDVGAVGEGGFENWKGDIVGNKAAGDGVSCDEMLEMLY